ncbi:MAG: carboxymuconolactone decarboxylase family protein [Acidimicrobiales bacterium]|nr:carboxymuconolactone decarboxylase family protein [Acidimicrobiales bacterium]
MRKPDRIGHDSPEEVLPPSLRRALENCAPVAAGGMDRLIKIALADGALPCSTKLLFLAGIAATRLEPKLTNEFLASALRHGLEPQAAMGAAATLLVSRGIPPCGILLDGLHECLDAQAPTDQIEPDPVRSSPGEALNYAELAYGLVPPHIEFMASELPEALEGFHLLRSGGLRRASFSPMLTELFLVAVNTALMQPEFVERHSREARMEGASEKELAEAALTAVPLAGLAAWRRGAEGILASRS